MKNYLELVGRSSQKDSYPGTSGIKLKDVEEKDFDTAGLLPLSPLTATNTLFNSENRILDLMWDKTSL